MALVGDIIISARELFPDRCGTLATPSGFSTALFAQAPTLPTGTYVIQVTVFTAWGESSAVTLTSQTIDINHSIEVIGSVPVGATKVRFYFGIGSVNQYQDFTSLPVPSVISAPGTAGVPPATAGGTPINRAYLPDTDGSFVSAATIYRWFNEALDEATDISGGIQDRTGVGSTLGVALYQLPIIGWKKITNVWYDGYDVWSGQKRDIFRRNVTSAYSVISVAVTLTPNSVIEAFPQPQRTSASTTTTASLSTTATSIALTSSTSFVLPFGAASITQGTNTEIVFYSSVSGNVMSGMFRGLGGSVPTAFTSGATVTELNFLIDGYRRAVPVNLGDANKQLQVPPAWASVLPLYLLSKFRSAEKEFREADNLMKQFVEKIKMEAASTKQLSGPVQIGSANRGPEIRASGPWGVIVP